LDESSVAGQLQHDHPTEQIERTGKAVALAALYQRQRIIRRDQQGSWRILQTPFYRARLERTPTRMRRHFRKRLLHEPTHWQCTHRIGLAVVRAVVHRKSLEDS
jgi:hypothetical protein